MIVSFSCRSSLGWVLHIFIPYLMLGKQVVCTRFIDSGLQGTSVIQGGHFSAIATDVAARRLDIPESRC
ncbi:hypothetical protein Hanom_Chr00s000001g01594211 [Helianthus anomalus]